MNKNKCRHFTGIRLMGKGHCCEAGVEYRGIAKVEQLGETGSALRIPCLGKEPGTVERGQEVQYCSKYDPYTPEELQQIEDEWEKTHAKILSGKSPCCDAGLDTSQVIKSGTHKGHGPRFCSACGKLVYMV